MNTLILVGKTSNTYGDFDFHDIFSNPNVRISNGKFIINDKTYFIDELTKAYLNGVLLVENGELYIENIYKI